MYDMVTLLNLGKNILKKVNHYPYSKCQICGHKIMLIDMKYGKPCKPYLLHNWQKKCHCGCTTPVMKRKEFNELINFSKEQRLKELELENGVVK